MATVSSVTRQRGQDHFHPEAELSPESARRMRGYLERIDYAAYAANRDMVLKTIGQVDFATFQQLAAAAAHARADWLASAIAITRSGANPNGEDVARMGAKRRAFEELSEAYEGMRRAVERGYLRYSEKP